MAMNAHCEHGRGDMGCEEHSTPSKMKAPWGEVSCSSSEVAPRQHKPPMRPYTMPFAHHPIRPVNQSGTVTGHVIHHMTQTLFVVLPGHIRCEE